MNEDNRIPGDNHAPQVPLPPIPPKAVFAVTMVILVVAAFFAGRYSAQMKPASSLFAQAPPTPLPLATPLPETESSLTMIDFTGVSEAKKALVLASFNSQACQCNCKMTVAACMVRDPGCPFWNDHVTQFQKALGNGKKPRVSRAPQPGVMMAPSNGRLVLPQGGTSGFTPPQPSSNGYIPPSQTGK